MLWLLAGAYALVLFTCTHLPPAHLPNTHVPDKIEHFGAYAILGALLAIAAKNSGWRRATLAVIVLGVVAGAVDEWTQPLVGRFCELNDWLSDAAGVIVAACLVALLLPARRSEPIGLSDS